ncbi:MAG: endopeptidase La [Bacteroidales bacterium]|nr:endopeptidase La [Bacteroidales bacterium]
MKLIDDDFLMSDMVDSGNSDFIPVLTIDDIHLNQDEKVPDVLPVLPLRNSVLYPGVVIPITVGRSKSMQLVKEYYKKRKPIGVVAQKDANVEEPGIADLYPVGTVAQILKTFQMPDGNMTVIIQGKRRFEIVEVQQMEPYFIAMVQPFEASEEVPRDRKFKALIQSVKELAVQVVGKNQRLPEEAGFAIKNIDDPVFLLNFVASNVEADLPTKQLMLECTNVVDMANNLLGVLTTAQQMNELKQQIQSKVKTDLDKQQREFLLNQQLRTIQEELGGSPNEHDIKELQEKAAKKKWTKEVQEVFERELKKLERTNPQAAEYGIQLNYLQYLVDLPWMDYTKDNFDLKRAQKILDADHFGLDKVKERIIEHLAVLKLKNDMKAPILCLVGPPGVGKTSLGKSIARALNRKYVRMSLGGVRDESELRGHRKTYIGAMPGRIIQNLRKVKSGNPVFVLDEIDKVSGNNISGDPQAALLEILDPEQNSTFYDNFMELDYDLSKILFIATANTLSTIHPALRDRMEIIDINGYLREEKYEIAKRHLIPKQLKEHGMDATQITFPKDIVMRIIDDYTREAGVRNLERRIADVMRARAKDVVLEQSSGRKVTVEELRKVLGVPMHHDEDEVKHPMPGVATGLAWTSVGGEILSIEVSLSRGGGHLSLTGNLGDVMKESATIAYEFIKAHSSLLEINSDVFDAWNVHIHVPEGATPKDGPSAGITMLAALTSAFTQRKVKGQLAMTGEITLRGKVLPVGGIKEKILAAKRNGVTDIILSIDNERDIKDIKEDYVEGLKFHYVKNMLEVIDLALEKEQDHNDLDYNKYLMNLRTEVIGFRN